MSVRIVFEPWTAPDGQVQNVMDETLASDETVRFDHGWLHVESQFDSIGGSERRPARSYPAHTISAVIWSGT